MSGKSPSRWWYVIAVSMVTTFIIVLSNNIGGEGFSTVTLPIGVVAFLLTILTAPLLGISQFLDARAVAKENFGWEPNKYFYGIAGLPQLGLFIGLESLAVLTIPVSFFYLYRRHRYIGTP